MKRILLLGDINSPHIQKWASALVEKGLMIGVFSLSKSTTDWYKQLSNFKLFDEHSFGRDSFYKNTFQKISFLKVLPSLKKAIRDFAPDIVHAHYASSYGLIGALSKFHPFIISVWGSDVFDFPKQNFINKKVLRYNFKKADVILSTSKAMKGETELYTDRNILITPFGVDVNIFKPTASRFTNKDEIVIGTIKTMEETYGISYLIKAFKILENKHSHLNLRLLLVGDGSQINEYKKLVDDLDLSSKVTFEGRIPYAEVVSYHNMLDIFVAVSISESFGVAILEASACEKPVVVSDVGGLPEVVKDGVTGFIVPLKDSEATASAIEKLILNKNLRNSIGKNGRLFVLENYDWNKSVDTMTNIYLSTIN